VFFVRARPGWTPRVGSERAWSGAFALVPANVPHALMSIGLANRVLRLGKISNLLRVATEGGFSQPGDGDDEAVGLGLSSTSVDAAEGGEPESGSSSEPLSFDSE